METTRFSRLELAFMLAVPFGWAALLMFHPNPTNNIHAGLHHEATRWLIVHLGSLVCTDNFAAINGAARRCDISARVSPTVTPDRHERQLRDDHHPALPPTPWSFAITAAKTALPAASTGSVPIRIAQTARPAL